MVLQTFGLMDCQKLVNMEWAIVKWAVTFYVNTLSIGNIAFSDIIHICVKQLAKVYRTYNESTI